MKINELNDDDGGYPDDIDDYEDSLGVDVVNKHKINPENKDMSKKENNVSISDIQKDSFGKFVVRST